MKELHTWIPVSGDRIQCPHCSATMPAPSNADKLFVSCTKCDSILYNEQILYEETLQHVDNIYKYTAIEYDHNVEAIKYFMLKYGYLQKLSSVLLHFFDTVSTQVLGKDYYIVDPVDGITAVEATTKDVMKNLSKRKRRWRNGR